MSKGSDLSNGTTASTNGTANSIRESDSNSNSAKTLQSLYARATKAFIQRNFLLTYSLMESAFPLLPPPSSVSPDGLAAHRRKWDILRITLEATLYSTPNSPQAGTGLREDALPARLRETLSLAPVQFVESLHNRSQILFTPTLAPMPSSAFLPGQVLVTHIAAALKTRCPHMARNFVEDWLVRRNQIEWTAPRDDELDGTLKVIEMYCLNVLPQLDEWEEAEEFVRMNSQLSEEKKQEYITYLQSSRKEAHTSITPPKSPTPTSTPTNGRVNGFKIRANVPPTPPRSPSPARSTTSLSTTSTHTVVPSGSHFTRLNGNGALTPLSRASTVTPTLKGKEREVRSHAMPSLRPPAAPPIEETSSLDLTAPRIYSLIKSLVLPHLTASNIALFVLSVVPLLIAFLLRLRNRRRGAHVSSSTRISGVAQEARKKLRQQGGGAAVVVGLSVELWRAIRDTVTMAGRGLV